MASTLSFDRENDPDVLCMIGSSAALHVSPIPFLKVTGSVRVGRNGNEFIVMPTYAQMEHSDLDLVVSGTRDAITMIEGFAREMSEEHMTSAIMVAHREVVRIIDFIEDFRIKAGLGAKDLPRRLPTTRSRASSSKSFTTSPHPQANQRQGRPRRSHPRPARAHLHRIHPRGRQRQT